MMNLSQQIYYKKIHVDRRNTKQRHQENQQEYSEWFIHELSYLTKDHEGTSAVTPTTQQFLNLETIDGATIPRYETVPLRIRPEQAKRMRKLYKGKRTINHP